MTRRHHRKIKESKSILPDPFVKGRAGQLIFEADLTQQASGYGGSFITPIDYRLDVYPSDDDVRHYVEPYAPMPLKTREIDEFWVTSPLMMYLDDTRYLYNNSGNYDYIKYLGLHKEHFAGLTQDVSEYELLKAYGNQMYRREGVESFTQLHTGFGKRNLIYNGFEKEDLPQPKEVDLIIKSPEDQLAGVFSTATGSGYSTSLIWNNDTTDPRYTPLLGKRIKYIDIYVKTPYTTNPMYIVFTAPPNHEKRKYTFGATAGWNRIQIDKVMPTVHKAFEIYVSDGEIGVNKTNNASKIGQFTYKNSWQYMGYATWDFGFGFVIDEDYYPYKTHWQEETDRWRIPLREEMLQLLGQAPAVSDDIVDRFSHFIGAGADENKYNISYKRFGQYENTSGFSSFPIGWSNGGASDPKMDFGIATVLFCGWIQGMGNNDTQPLDRFHIFHENAGGGRDKGILIRQKQYNLASSANVHLFKRKRASESGYILRVNEERDAVEFHSTEGMVDNWVKPYTGKHYDNNGDRKNNYASNNTTFAEWNFAEYCIEVPDSSYKYLEYSIKHQAGASSIWFFDKDMNSLGSWGQADTQDYITYSSLQFDRYGAVKYIYVNSVYNHEVNGFTLRVWKDRPSELPELFYGIERGVALRYANRKQRQVLKSYSDIKAEAADIMSKIEIV